MEPIAQKPILRVFHFKFMSLKEVFMLISYKVNQRQCTSIYANY